MIALVRIASLHTLVLMLVILPIDTFANGEKKESLYEQMIRNVVQIEEHQSICTPGRVWAEERDIPIGTGFFVVRSEGDERNAFFVTARHNVEKRKNLFIRLPRSPGSSQAIFLTLHRKLWIFHPGPNPGNTFPIDVAVMSVAIPKPAIVFLYCPGDCPIDPKTNKPQNEQVISSPAATERTLFFGFPRGDVAPRSFEPFARSGVVAYTAPNPNLRIDGKILADKSVYYVDAPAFPGNSGGPVMAESFPLRRRIRLWGLITGGNMLGRDYAIVTPVERIIETIEHAIFLKPSQNRDWKEKPPELPIRCISDKQ